MDTIRKDLVELLKTEFPEATDLITYADEFNLQLWQTCYFEEAEFQRIRELIAVHFNKPLFEFYNDIETLTINCIVDQIIYNSLPPNRPQ